jgi:hypothetical protein
VHTEEKPYQCEHCHKSFTAKASLYVHIHCFSNVNVFYGFFPFLLGTLFQVKRNNRLATETDYRNIFVITSDVQVASVWISIQASYAVNEVWIVFPCFIQDSCSYPEIFFLGSKRLIF